MTPVSIGVTPRVACSTRHGRLAGIHLTRLRARRQPTRGCIYCLLAKQDGVVEPSRVQAAPQQTGGRVRMADWIKAGLVCLPGGGEPFFGLGEPAGEEVQPAEQRIPPSGGHRLRDHYRELSGRGRLAAAQQKLNGIKQQPVTIHAVRRQPGCPRQPDRSRPRRRHAARPAPSQHLISSQSVYVRSARLTKITQLRSRCPQPMTSRMTCRVVLTGQVIFGQPAICPLGLRPRPRFLVSRRETVPRTPNNVAVTGQPSARSLELIGQTGIRADRRCEPMPQTLPWRADLGRPPVQLTAPSRVYLAVDDELADSISELNLPTKVTELAELAELRAFCEQSSLGGLG
jgi:hypothetical protein